MKRLSPKAFNRRPAIYRFLAEAQIASQLDHPGILPIFDAGLDPDGRPFYTTQLLPGTTLADVLTGTQLPSPSEWSVNRALELLLRVCDIMGHAHSRGVIHRDLKPSNILVGAFGDVRVIDWGSAHILKQAQKNFEEPFTPVNITTIQTDRDEAIESGPESVYATSKSGMSMTLLFTAPELLRGEVDNIGTRTDVYSMGVMLYDLATGRPPYSDKNRQLPKDDDLKELIKRGPPPPVRKINPKGSRDLAAICMKAMAHDIAQRYPTMAALGDDIRAALELRPVSARHPGLLLKARRFAQRNAGYVMLASLFLVLVLAAVAVSGQLRRQRDVALQVKALRDAELAARSGHWREALHRLDESEASGYNDSISLGLQRAEAWTALNEPERSGNELRKLVRRSDLGPRQGTVLLRMGEHELFDKSTAAAGVAHIRQALSAALSPSERTTAQGLLAESATNALVLLQTALQLDPYSLPAHRHSLGLEFLLGRHAEVASHVHVFEILYPDDPSPRYLQAAELALDGRLTNAEALLVSLQGSTDPGLWKQQTSALRSMAEAAAFNSADALLSNIALISSNAAQSKANANFALAANAFGASSGSWQFRVPHLPCIEHGFLNGTAGVQALGMPFLKDLNPAIARIKSSWAVYPEGLLPFRAAIILDSRQPTNGAKSIPLLAIQAQLFQMAADSPPLMPNLQRSARCLASKAENELIQSDPDTFADMRMGCLRNIEFASDFPGTSALECRFYFPMAVQFRDYGAARRFLDHWAQLAPDDAHIPHDRIELELAAGNFASALNLVDGILAHAPADNWALEQRRVVLNKLQDILRTPQPGGNPTPDFDRDPTRSTAP